MKYLTMWLWKQGQASPQYWDEAKQGVEAYWKYYNSIKSQLPAKLRTFTSKYSFHDGHLEGLFVDMNSRQMSLYANGYEIIKDQLDGEIVPLKLHYRELSEYYLTVEANKHLSLSDCSALGDIGDDEIELLADGRIEQRILFSSGLEFTIRFRKFAFDDPKGSVYRATNKSNRIAKSVKK